ncbi:hypothetical protein GGS21DRAFT_547359 [Xylaria nigripes]|nr:hypothetical protein GGS21DRAFT_547359 [Xylaria nigripes]
MADINGEDLRMACLALDQLDELMLAEFLTAHNGRIYWEHKVLGTGQNKTRVCIDVETPDGRCISEKRIEKWKTVINPGCSNNFGRVSGSHPDTLLERDPDLQACKAAEDIPEAKTKLALASFAVCYDFRQHYATE